jgi:hypothetical protein
MLRDYYVIRMYCMIYIVQTFIRKVIACPVWKIKKKKKNWLYLSPESICEEEHKLNYINNVGEIVLHVSLCLVTPALDLDSAANIISYYLLPKYRHKNPMQLFRQLITNFSQEPWVQSQDSSFWNCNRLVLHLWHT